MKIGKTFLIIFLFLFFAISIFSQGMLNRANTLYSGGKYKEALKIYLKILKDKNIHNAYLYYNIGNCYFKLGKLPQSILFYERAHLLKPDDSEIEYNLKFARSLLKGKYEIEPENPIEIIATKVLNVFSINFLSILFLIFFLAVNVSFYFYFKFRKGQGKKRALFIFITTLLIFFIIGGMLFTRYETVENYNYGIVMQNGNVYSGPGNSFTLLFNLSSGTKVKIIEKKDNFYHIRAGKGFEGWINSKLVEKIRDF